MLLNLEPYVTKNILNISHIPGNKAELSARTEQRLGTDTAPTIYAMQTQFSVSIHIYPEILGSDRSFKNTQLCYGIF
jgi:hypothetical protein